MLGGELQLPDEYWINRQKFEQVRFKPRGWSWIDPTKEVSAYRTAVRAGFMTVSDVIAQTASGADVEDVFKGRRQELDMAADLDLVFDTDPSQVDEAGTAQPVPVDPAPEEDEPTATAAAEAGDGA